MFSVLFVIYAATATYDERQSLDARAAAIASWHLATYGELTLDDVQPETRDPWFVQTDDGIVSNRHPGIIAFALPFYAGRALFTDSFSLGPAAVAAATAAAGAMALMYLVYRRLTDANAALAATAVSALGTATWSVSADALWPHGIDQLWLTAAVLAVATERFALAGAPFGLALFTRPPTAVVAAVVGLVAAWGQRRLRPVLLIAAGSGAGLLALLLYNAAIFGELSIAGGYSTRFISVDFAGTGANMSFVSYLGEIALTFVSPRGILVWSPFVALLLPGIPQAWRDAPLWVRAAALAGLAYMLLHLRFEHYGGGSAFFAYRYPLEPLTLAAPLLLLSYMSWTRRGHLRRAAFWILAVAAIVVHGLGASLYHLVLVPS